MKKAPGGEGSVRAPRRRTRASRRSRAGRSRPLYRPRGRAPGSTTRGTSATPASIPYTRGIHETMYRGKALDHAAVRRLRHARPRPTSASSTCSSTAAAGLSVAFDLPTLMGRDPDHPLSLGEVGKCGVAVSSLADMETLFDGIPLDQVTTSMTINSPAAMLLAFYILVGEKQGVAPGEARGHAADRHPEGVHRPEGVHLPAAAEHADHRGHDPLLHRAHAEVEHDLDLRLPHPRGGLDRGPGAGLHAARRDRVRAVVRGRRDGRGRLRPAAVSFFFNSHSDFFEEIAKFRAARRIWARTMRERFGAKNPRSWMLRFHTQTAGVSLTAQQPYNNVVRTALQALAGVLGGTQSLHTNSLDEALALPTEEAVTIALRTQQVIAHESGVANTADPLGGSWLRREADERDRGRGPRVLPPDRRAWAAWWRRSSGASRSGRSRRRPSASSRRSSARRR